MTLSLQTKVATAIVIARDGLVNDARQSEQFMEVVQDTEVVRWLRRLERRGLLPKRQTEV